MKKIASIFLAMLILNASFISCKSSKMLSIDEASEMKEKEKYLVLHTQKKTFSLHNYNFSDDKLTGDLQVKKSSKGYIVHVYSDISHDIAVEELQSAYLELPYSGINRIVYMKKEPGKTALLTGGIIGGIFLIIGLIGAATFTM